MPILKTVKLNQNKTVLSIEFDSAQQRELFISDLANTAMPLPPDIYREVLFIQIKPSDFHENLLYIMDLDSSTVLLRSDNSVFKIGIYKTLGDYDQLNINFGYTVIAQKIAELLCLELGENLDCINDHGVLRFYQPKLNFSGSNYLNKPYVRFVSKPAKQDVQENKKDDIGAANINTSYGVQYNSEYMHDSPVQAEQESMPRTNNQPNMLTEQQKSRLYGLLGDDIERVAIVNNTGTEVDANSIHLEIDSNDMDYFQNICDKIRTRSGLFKDFGRDRNKNLYINLNKSAL